MTPKTASSGTQSPHPEDGPGMTRVRIDVGYDGSGFSGWARQPGRRTVQQTLEDALCRVLRLPAPPQLTVAGRTDAGVHARGQVAHVDLPGGCWAGAQDAAQRRLCGILPPDVRVHRIATAPPGFDARFSAVWRRYAYRVCDDPAGADPLRRHETLWYPRRLAVDDMNEAARACLGEHDFAAFCRGREGASTVRELLRLEWSRPEPTLAVATVVADAFCHHMVRAMVGALLRVGEGARPAGWPAQVLAAAERDPAVPVVAPHALCLEEVGYPPDDQLARRALATRRVRAAPGAGG
jgi:tRNA pseudouridine38-40 synthase